MLRPNAHRLRFASVIIMSGVAIVACGCAHRVVVNGPPSPDATKVVRIDVSGSYFRNSAPHAITDPAAIAAIASSRWFAAGGWQLHGGPLTGDPNYVIEFQSAQGRLARYTSSPISCLWMSCPGWIGFEGPDGQRLIRRLGEASYMSFVATLLKGYGRKSAGLSGAR